MTDGLLWRLAKIIPSSTEQFDRLRSILCTTLPAARRSFPSEPKPERFDAHPWEVGVEAPRQSRPVVVRD